MAEPDGGINTWILDPRGRSPADEHVRAYVPIMGGWGIHPEVVANFSYGLWLYNSERFEVPLRSSAEFLATVQAKDGHWDSHWYAGSYYGTFKALALLAAVMPGHPAIQRGQQFLRSTQRTDGFWGDEEHDPLASAFALLSLLQVWDASDTERLALGMRALVSAQREGAWEARPWIQFGTLDGVERFGSATITTAFCVKALAGLVRRFGHHQCANLFVT
jgi:squalene-hopene/tetraprenyl-beta-curcumene cyclase